MVPIFPAMDGNGALLEVAIRVPAPMRMEYVMVTRTAESNASIVAAPLILVGREITGVLAGSLSWSWEA